MTAPFSGVVFLPVHSTAPESFNTEPAEFFNNFSFTLREAFEVRHFKGMIAAAAQHAKIESHITMFHDTPLFRLKLTDS